jgi:hypothetical protein
MNRRMITGAFAGALMAAGLAGVAVAPAERVVIREEQQDAKKLERQVNRLRRRLHVPARNGSKEMVRRVRQIATGQLRAANGLHADSAEHPL